MDTRGRRAREDKDSFLPPFGRFRFGVRENLLVGYLSEVVHLPVTGKRSKLCKSPSSLSVEHAYIPGF